MITCKQEIYATKKMSQSADDGLLVDVPSIGIYLRCMLYASVAFRE